jgi:hypothetical protein
MSRTLGVTILLLIFLTSCTNSDVAENTQTPSPSPTLATSAQPTPTTPTPSTAISKCLDNPELITMESTLRLLADQWSIVIAAKGESDEQERIKEFQEDLKYDVYEELDQASGCGKETVASAELQFEASLLSFEPENAQYDKVAVAGNALLDQMGVTDAQFIKAKCHGHVDETAGCTAIRE